MSNYQNEYKRAVSAYLLEDYELAGKILKTLLQKRPEDNLLYILSGNIHEACCNLKEAAREYKKAIRLSPDNPEAYNNLGVIYKNAGDFAKSETAFKQAMALAPERADISYNYGNLLKKRGNTEGAEKWYKRSLEQDPAYIKAYNNLGTIYEQNKEFDKAEEIYRAGLAIDRNNATLHYNLGLTYQDRGNMEQARTQYEESLKFRPGWVPGLNTLGEILQEQGYLEEAEKKFSQLLDKSPDNARAISNMGAIAARRGNNEKARQYFKKALDKEPSYKPASLNLKKIYMKEDSLQEAFEELRTQAKYHPGDMNIQLQIGEIMMKLENYKEAENVFNHVLEKEQDSLEAYKSLAKLYAFQLRPKLVHSCIIEIFKLDPSNKSILIALSRIYLDNNHPKEALETIDEYLKEQPESHEALCFKAKILQSLNKPEKAAALYDRISNHSDFSSDPEVLADMAEAYFQSGAKEKAADRLETLLNIQGDSSNPEDLTEFSQTLELYEKTVASFQESSKNWQSNLDKIRELASKNKTRPLMDDFSTTEISKMPIELEDTISLLDISTMEPVIHIKEEEELLVFEDVNEDFEGVYTEVMKEKALPEQEENSSPGVLPVENALPAEDIPAASVTPDSPEQAEQSEEKTKKEKEAVSNKELQQERPPKNQPEEGKNPSGSPPQTQEDGQTSPRSLPATKEGRIPGEENAIHLNAAKISAMIGYLLNLSHDLPQNKKENLIAQEIPLKMASVIKRLSGGPHFKEKALSCGGLAKKTSPLECVIDNSRMKKSLSAFKRLTKQHPDDLISSAFTKKMDSLIGKVKTCL